jgi:hypothetical protein
MSKTLKTMAILGAVAATAGTHATVASAMSKENVMALHLPVKMIALLDQALLVQALQLSTIKEMRGNLLKLALALQPNCLMRLS